MHHLSEKTTVELERRLREVGCELEALLQARDSGELVSALAEPAVSSFTRERLATELRRIERALTPSSCAKDGMAEPKARPAAR